jgi:hypothetical protein
MQAGSAMAWHYPLALEVLENMCLDPIIMVSVELPRWNISWEYFMGLSLIASD